MFCTDLSDSIGTSLYTYHVIQGGAYLFPINDNGNPAVSVEQMMALGYLFAAHHGVSGKTHVDTLLSIQAPMTPSLLLHYRDSASP